MTSSIPGIGSGMISFRINKIIAPGRGKVQQSAIPSSDTNKKSSLKICLD
jgi:hypothetical protein